MNAPRFPLPHGVILALNALRGAGYEAYLVGGCVRDLLRGETPHDWDICTSALPEQTRACFPGLPVADTGIKHGTVTVWADGLPLEITTYRVDGSYSDGRRPDRVRFVASLREDLARRDFTINAVALDPDGSVLDFFGGQADIRGRLIRCVGDPRRRFREDGLRILRALRFAAVLGYAIEDQTAAALHEARPMLRQVAAERVRDEVCKLLAGRWAGDVLRRFPDIFLEFWPELAPLLPLKQHHPWHCWGGWEHTLHAVEAAPAEPLLRLTMLFHDSGKPACKTTDENGIDHFTGHPAVSARLAEQMLRTLKFDNAARERIVRLVREHDSRLEPTEKAVRRWLNRLGPEDFFRLLDVQRADAAAQNPVKAKDRFPVLDAVQKTAETVLAQGQCFRLADLAVNGRDVLAAGAAPGPQIGRVLQELLEQVLSGQVPNDRDALLALIERQVRADIEPCP